MWALIQNGQVVETVQGKKNCFPVHPSMKWQYAGNVAGVAYGWAFDDENGFTPPPPPREPTYAEKRREEYPAVGDQLDLAFKQRQKARLNVGKARAAMDEGKTAEAFALLAEALEPIAESHDIDAEIQRVKAAYPKPESEGA